MSEKPIIERFREDAARVASVLLPGEGGKAGSAGEEDAHVSTNVSGEVFWERVVFEDEHVRESIRVVSFGGAAPLLEKRHFWRDSHTKKWRVGKVRGFNGMDLALALDRLEEFREVLFKPWKSGSLGRST